MAELGSSFEDPGLADACIAHLVATGRIVREGTTIRLPHHSATTTGREDAGRLVAEVEAREPYPPTVRELVAAGFGPELIRAACADGRLIRVSTDVVISPGLLHRAEAIVRERGGPPGLTVSVFREALGTSRKYALPILEYFDSKGLTRRSGDVRILRGM
jgi:selenocysteine-specific elongation factor